MKITRKGLHELYGPDDSLVSRHTDTDEAYESAHTHAQSLPPGKYTYRLRPAEKEIEVSTLSRTVFNVDTTAPSVPGNVSATALSTSAIRVSWSASTDTGGSGLSGYRVYRSTTSGGTYTQIGGDLTTASLSYDDTGLSASTTRYYKVSAFDGNGNESTLSAVVSATTQAASQPGALVHGQTTTISDGLSLSGNTIVVYDDFSTGALGSNTHNSAAVVGSWDSSGTYESPVRSNAASRGVHTRNAYISHWNGDGGSQSRALALNRNFTGEWYMDWWQRFGPAPDNNTPGWTRNYKPWRFYDSRGPQFGDNFTLTYQGPGNDDPNSSNTQFYTGGLGNPYINGMPTVAHQWEHWRLRFRVGATYATDLINLYRTHKGQIYNGGWRSSGQTFIPVELRIGAYWARDGNATWGANSGGQVYVSSIMIQQGWARVELGNHATYSSATITEIQRPTSSTQYVVNKGMLSSGTVYEYVFDASNTLVKTTARTMQ